MTKQQDTEILDTVIVLESNGISQTGTIWSFLRKYADPQDKLKALSIIIKQND